MIHSFVFMDKNISHFFTSRREINIIFCYLLLILCVIPTYDFDALKISLLLKCHFHSNIYLMSWFIFCILVTKKLIIIFNFLTMKLNFLSYWSAFPADSRCTISKENASMVSKCHILTENYLLFRLHVYLSHLVQSNYNNLSLL